MAEPKYKPGWEDIDELIARRDREDKDPNCGPHPSTGYPRFMWIRSRWGWDTDQWSQHRNLHDTSSAWRDEAGTLRFFCTCGLIVEMPEPRCREWTRRSGFHNFHARDRNHCAECDRIFFSASGHRDAYGVFDGPAFAARLSQAEGSCVHLWCPNCGDCGEIVGAFNSDEDFVGELVTTAINTHNSTCSSESITQAE